MCPIVTRTGKAVVLLNLKLGIMRIRWWTGARCCDGPGSVPLKLTTLLVNSSLEVICVIYLGSDPSVFGRLRGV